MELNRPVSTISRELKRNTLGLRPKYVPRLAQERAQERILNRGRRERLKSQEIRDYVKAMLQSHYSPEQIAGRIGRGIPGTKISYEAIYKYIYSHIYSQYCRKGYGRCIGEDLRIYLKRRHKTRYPKYIPFRPQRQKIIGAISISERPKEIELRKELGHWEGDSVVSRQGKFALNTLAGYLGLEPWFWQAQ